MATVNGMTAEAMQEIAKASIISGSVNSGGDLILSTRGGTPINAGRVKGDSGEDATAKLLPLQSDDILLSLTGKGTNLDPWQLKAELKQKNVLMQIAPGNIGPGPTYVTEVGSGLGTKYGPYDWDGKFDPTGSPLVRLEGRNGGYVITGHASGNSIGSIREIPLTSNWTTYSMRNGSHFGPPSEYLQGTLTPTGIVVLQGLYVARNTTSGNTSGSLVGTLPPDMCPDYAMLYGVNLSDTVAELQINPNGQIILRSNISAGQFISLTNIAFPAAGVANWIAITGFINGYSNWGDASYGIPRYWVDPYGVCWWAGLVKIGTATANTTMFPLPTGLGQLDSHHITAASGSTYTGFRVTGTVTSGTTTGKVDFLVGPASGGYISLCGATSLTSSALTLLNWDNIYNLGRFTNGFTAYNATAGTGNQQPIITRRPDGMVMSYGLVSNSAATMGTPIFFLPERYLPNSTLLQQNMSNQARGRVDISGRINTTAGNVKGFIASQGATPWYSIDNLKWIPGGIA